MVSRYRTSTCHLSHIKQVHGKHNSF
uniref:Uncharacterized protein n=1 Tax=Arundo donax TaxID=35708 RepID=A0A0A8YC66_ARUDO